MDWTEWAELTVGLGRRAGLRAHEEAILSITHRTDFLVLARYMQARERARAPARAHRTRPHCPEAPSGAVGSPQSRESFDLFDFVHLFGPRRSCPAPF